MEKLAGGIYSKFDIQWEWKEKVQFMKMVSKAPFRHTLETVGAVFDFKTTSSRPIDINLMDQWSYWDFFISHIWKRLLLHEIVWKKTWIQSGISVVWSTCVSCAFIEDIFVSSQLSFVYLCHLSALYIEFNCDYINTVRAPWAWHFLVVGLLNASLPHGIPYLLLLECKEHSNMQPVVS